jgi:hypothetical protein
MIRGRSKTPRSSINGDRERAGWRTNHTPPKARPMVRTDAHAPRVWIYTGFVSILRRTLAERPPAQAGRWHPTPPTHTRE